MNKVREDGKVITKGTLGPELSITQLHMRQHTVCCSLQTSTSNPYSRGTSPQPVPSSLTKDTTPVCPNFPTNNHIQVVLSFFLSLFLKTQRNHSGWTKLSREKETASRGKTPPPPSSMGGGSLITCGSKSPQICGTFERKKPPNCSAVSSFVVDEPGSAQKCVPEHRWRHTRHGRHRLCKWRLTELQPQHSCTPLSRHPRPRAAPSRRVAAFRGRQQAC